MQPLIIHDKLIHHLGFNMEAMTMFKSLEYNGKVIVKVNETFTRKIRIKSSAYYQGFPLSQFIWGTYINPLLLKIEQQQKIRNEKHDIISQTCIKALMDDITIYTKIHFHYYQEKQRSMYQKLISGMNECEKRRQTIPVQIQRKTAIMMQQTINMVNNYLSIVNVPVNEDKTQLMIIRRAQSEQKDKYRSNAAKVSTK